MEYFADETKGEVIALTREGIIPLRDIYKLYPSTRWIPIEEGLPINPWYKGSKFRIRLADGRLFKSYFEDGQWVISRLNPKMVVTHWMAPAIRA